jgi:DNA polymerase III epsilon subunit-like protein
MVKKLFYFDCETTGTDPKLHEITQLAYIIDVDGEAVCQRSILMRPLKPDTIDDEALKVQKRTREDLEQYAHPFLGYQQLISDFGAYVDKYDSQDKMVPVAWNASFDVSFISEFFTAQKDKFLGSWIDRRRTLDPQIFYRYFEFAGRIPKQENSKLATVAAVMGVSLIDAHDALSDVQAMRQINEKLMLELALRY